MDWARLYLRLRDAVRAFRANRNGNVAVTFGIVLVPVFGLVGAAVDYSRANADRSAVQVALDSTALAMAKIAASLTSSELQQQASAYFTAVFSRPEVQNLNLISTYDASKSAVTVSASAQVQTALLGIIGFKQLNFSSSATATMGMIKLRVALVLDNTGSMNDYGKIGALKTAAHQFLKTMQSSAQNAGDIQVAIVPFNTDVNVGTGYVNAPWLDWTFLSQASGSWATSSWTTTGGAYWGTRTGWAGSTWDPSGSYTGSGSWSTTSWGGSATGTVQSGWSGCVMDRDQNYDVLNTNPTSSNPATYFPADNPSYGCPASLMPLSYDWTALNAKIDEMTAIGTTNQTIGLAWGWQALTTGMPLSAPALPANTQQIIILLTDGMNTESRYSSTQAQIDARTDTVCSNIKSAGITIYTVLVMAGDSSILKSCATDSGKYFALTAAGDVVTTFNQIASVLTALRISN